MKNSKKQAEDIICEMTDDFGRFRPGSWILERELKRIYRNGYKAGRRKRK